MKIYATQKEEINWGENGHGKLNKGKILGMLKQSQMLDLYIKCMYSP